MRRTKRDILEDREQYKFNAYANGWDDAQDGFTPYFMLQRYRHDRRLRYEYIKGRHAGMRDYLKNGWNTKLPRRRHPLTGYKLRGHYGYDGKPYSDFVEVGYDFDPVELEQATDEHLRYCLEWQNAHRETG